MTPEELEMIRGAATDSEMFKQVFDQYKPMVLRVITAYYIRDYTRDDWLQEARIAMLKAISHYDGTAGSKFGPFYRMVLLSHIHSLLRKHLAQKRSADTNAMVMANPGAILPPSFASGQRIEDNLVLRSQLGEYVAQLSPLERRGLQMVLENSDAATRRAYRRAIERSKLKLTQYFSAQMN
ncbi:sigma-70 family RNA polymerase sigma factor [Lacticaseibacillus hegangensis]|uniref:Sigma-70 family RNA polymerase sigma factor n=1 Tax=Lacticaseibacillus hegangensis TaxID=2486010 RepID=A0ABW4CRG7_9LACO|nr:sigma-70 family RNA polymerase sigma factor [Lacticaseibacillus hegangensis]